MKNDVWTLQNDFVKHLEFSQGKDKYTSTSHDFYKSLVYTVRDRLFERWIETQQTYYKKDVKRVYYISMEYMLGRLLSNALLNLKLTENLKQGLWELGLDLEELQQNEHDAGLGNGGLGRLAACFLDSMATLELPAQGYGIRYEYGIFSQKIQNGRQYEAPDPWLQFGNPWEIERPEYNYRIQFYGRNEAYTDDQGRERFHLVDTEDVLAVAYDTPIPGYGNNTVNNLRLWAAKSTQEFNLEYFNHGDYDRAVEDKANAELISKVLYPRDDFIEGRELRLKQEFFLVSATLQDILRRYKRTHDNFDAFPQKVAIQLNDTHPALCIPELMRLLMDREFMSWKQAWDIVIQVFAYTNHTILPEALETWRTSLMEKILPRHLQIIYEINRRFLEENKKQYPKNIKRLQRISMVSEEDDKRIRMAHLAIVGSHSVNGVADLHTKIIKKDIFRDFHDIWPDKFNNKTNGITQRRWLKLANPLLAELISDVIGDQWLTHLPHLKQLQDKRNDTGFKDQWNEAKYKNKECLAQYIQSELGTQVNPDSIFDCHIKRIHEYKRQLMNIMRVIDLYYTIKDKPDADVAPRTVIFAGKAAPAYTTAKLIIRLIHDVAAKVNSDETIGERLKIVFMPDFSVSLAQLIIPAADLSEQISTAGMEASGTGNMKFALNGAPTIGTLDGANIEIRDEVGNDNIFIFGMTADEVAQKRTESYNPQSLYQQDPRLKRVIDGIQNGEFSPDETQRYKPLADNLLSSDYFMVLADFKAYVSMQQNVDKAFKDKQRWTSISIQNTAGSGVFSSDRTIGQYAKEIWNIEPVSIKLNKDSNT
ncbi:MAG: glycogen/starch/alpha-glucan family phosphorylase [Caldithrix sp.]|nr:glycogen/starch/alpha-glucan family phosphorylase [Caldithrix sp.]